VVNAFAVAWAHELSPDPFWVEVASPTGPAQPDPAAVGQFPPDRLLVVSEPSRLAPADPMSSSVLGSLVRPEEDREAVGRLAEFLRLPQPVRDLANLGPAGAGPGAIVFANCDRLRPYYPGFASQNRELLESLRHVGVSVVYTLTGEPAPDRRNGPFDAVIEVEAESLRAWRRGFAIPERVPEGALLSVGRPRALPSLPEVARVLAHLSATE
jgi:hypothetical protein